MINDFPKVNKKPYRLKFWVRHLQHEVSKGIDN